MTVTAIVVNYNAGPLLVDCARSLIEANGVRDLRVVDNGSDDGSVDLLGEAFGNHPALTIRRNRDNDGFGPAVNSELANVISEFVLVINPDCSLGEGALEHLLRALEKEPAAGLAAPAVIDAGGRPERSALRFFPTPRRALLDFTGLAALAGRWPALRGVSVPPSEWPARPRAVEAVSGACLLLRRDALAEVGAFDEGYGLHCEDLDLMYRLREAGRPCLFVPAARAVHVKGVSSRRRPLWVHRQKHLGMRRFYLKFQAGGHSVPTRLLVLAGIHLRCMLLAPWIWPRVWLGAWLRR